MKKFVLFCTTAILPSAVFAQSTGTVEVEKDSIVITGTRAQKGVDGLVIQDSTKAKGLVTQEYIAKQSPGQTLLNTINLIPGVNFTQNDPYGSSGGNLRIRGFDGNRVSVTFDGVPLNDSGNYAVYPNQMLDPELVEEINVNLGATDVDSPTASAAGGTVNFRSIVPTDQLGVTADGSLGSFGFKRIFGMIETGQFTPFGTKAWFAASRNTYDMWRGDGKIKKWQVNGKIYQPLGGNGDFVSLAGHYNQNRNNNYNNPNLTDLRSLFGTTVVPSSPAEFPVEVGDYTNDQWHVIDNIAYASDCGTRAPGVKGTAQVDPGCGVNYLGTQINPSNTGNVRGQSRFTLTDGLVLTVDPTFQYVLADGGSQSVVMKETDELLRQGVAGAPGVDLNGDGDFMDSVLVGRPSITNTHRWTVVSSLVWRMNPSNTFRVAYTFDRAHHRQTGEYSFTDDHFNLTNPFFGRNGKPIITAADTVLQNRDRTSIALLNQVSGQYIGRFFDQRLRVELGVRSPWFVRDLDQHCYTPVLGAGFPVCVVNPVGLGYHIVAPDIDPTTADSKAVWAPFKAKYKYHKILPNVGATYALNESLSVFASYAKGFSAPRTDNLYRQPVINVKPETTDSFDLGARYIAGRFQAQGTFWKIGYKNRIVTSYDPETNTSIDRNVGKVSSWGFDAGLGFKPVHQLNLIGLLSYTDAKLKDDIIIGTVNYNPASPPKNLTPFQYFCSPLPTTTAPVQVCGKTTGKFVVETPKWQFGGRAELHVDPFTLGVQAKHVGSRFATDVNDVRTRGYTTVDLDARLDLERFIPLKKTYFQLNVINLLNEHYFGNLSTTINAYGVGSSAPRFTPVASRAVTGTLTLGF
ncbi:MAG TPA: TonB-dependent receptor [Sphingomicrobium sp.]|nr:TonB-dependent receptor [Sphingomicrobium sp.]